MRAAPRWIGYPASVLVVAATVGLLRLFPALTDSSVALLLLLAVFFCASLWQSGPGVLAALLATLGFNFFFLPPLYTFTIQDPRNVAALFVFLVSGLLIGRLSALSRRRLELLETERRDLIALTQLSQGFLSDTNRETLLGVAADRLRQALVCDQVAILLANEKGQLSQRIETASISFREDIAELAFRQGNSAAFPSELGGTDIYLPVPVGLQRAGVLVARGLRASERMAEACALLLGLAVERERFLRLTLAAEETRTSEQMKSTLLAQLAHDLKTPVAAASGAIENWEAASGGSDASRLAGEQLKALSRRVTELMDVVRLDSGAARPRPERVGCGEIVEAAVARFGEALADHTLVLEPPPPDVLVEVDPAQLTEALGHGLENAARYSPTGSTIHVSIVAEEQAVFFRVADQGRGVPPADRERVLERFVRLDDARDVPGSGLGLFIARSLVALNGGRLRLAEAHGGGTLFEIALPRSEGVSRVLVADDEPAIRKVVRDAFEREGHEVVAVIDGREALERFEEGAFDLVVTDLAMPNLGGLELVQEIRRRKSTMPILVLTVKNEERDKVRLLDAGADDFVTKPFGVAELLARARALLRRRGPEKAALTRWGDVEVEPEARTVRKNGRPVHLTPIEFSILLALIGKPGAVWTHRQLLAAVWGTTAGVTNDTLRVHMGSLRRKLEDDPNRPRWFRTEPWVGYRFAPED